MTAPFTPRRADGRALWRVAFDHIADGLDQGRIREGDLLPHAMLAQVMETEQDSYYYGTIAKVRTELQKERNRDLVPVRGKGYQLVTGRAQVDHGRAQHKSARRKMTKAVATVSTADLSAMSAQEQRDVGLLLRGMRHMSSILDQTIDQVNKHEEDIEELRRARDEAFRRSRATDDDVAAMQARLDRLEQGMSQR